VKPLVERGSLLAVLVLVALAILMVGRTVSRARAELGVADAHRQEGEIALAIEHYRRTLRWSFPFSPYTPAAIAALESIAGELENAGDGPGALLAWRSLAGGLAASRSSYVRTSDARDMAKDQIARLLSVHSDAAIDSSLSADKLEADHRRLLDEEASPDPLWSTFLLLGFAAWIGSLVLVIRQGFDSTGRPAWAGARRPLWGALLGFGAFVLGLLFA
jgi:hypothetical protein